MWHLWRRQWPRRGWPRRPGSARQWDRRRGGLFGEQQSLLRPRCLGKVGLESGGFPAVRLDLLGELLHLSSEGCDALIELLLLPHRVLNQIGDVDDLERLECGPDHLHDEFRVLIRKRSKEANDVADFHVCLLRNALPPPSFRRWTLVPPWWWVPVDSTMGAKSHAPPRGYHGEALVSMWARKSFGFGREPMSAKSLGGGFLPSVGYVIALDSMTCDRGPP